MKIDEVRKFLIDGDLTFQTREAIESVLKARQEGELSVEDEKEVRELLELEAQLLDVRAQLFEDLAAAAGNFGKEVNEIAAPDLEDLQESFNQRERNLKEFERSVGTRLDLLVSG